MSRIAQSLHTAGQTFGRMFHDNLGEDSPTVPQFIVLEALDKHPRGIKQCDLIDETGIDRSTLSALLRLIASRGLVRLERTTVDLRANRVSITRTGRNALSRARKAAKAAEKEFVRSHAALELKGMAA